MSTRESIAAYLSGGGDLITATFPNPGAGAANFTVAVPALRQRLLRSFNFIYTADANVANRLVRIIQQTNGADVFEMDSGVAVTAGQVVLFNIGTYGYTFVGTNRQAIGTPNTRYRPADQILRVEVTGVQVGDTMTALRGLFEEWVVS